MEKIARLILLLSILLAIHGCASIIDDKTREIVIDTPNGVKLQAVLNIDDSNYKIELPAKLDIERGVKKKLNLQINSPCGKMVDRTLPRELAPMVFANGIGIIGYAVDAFTGAASRYQPHSLVPMQNEQSCADAGPMARVNRASQILSVENVPANGDGWKAGGIVVFSIGFVVTAMDTGNKAIFDIFDKDEDKDRTINIGPLLGGLLVGGGMYAYGIKQSSEYRQWKKKRFGNIANIGVLVNTDSGVRLHYQREF